MIKKNAFLLLLILSNLSFGQNESKDKEKLLKEQAGNACLCVDSIQTTKLSKKEITDEISNCINVQTSVYLLTTKLLNITELAENAEEKNGKKEITVNLDIDMDSKEYKEAYYELERYMMKNCEPLKTKAASNDDQNKHSLSNNLEALKYYDQGIELMKSEKYEKALKTFNKAIGIDPIFAFAWDNIGLCYRKMGEYDKAIEAYTKSLEIDPDGIFPLQNMAVAYQYKKEYAKAIQTYERLIDIDDRNPEIYYGIGQIYAIYLNDMEKGLDNMCKAYNLYIENKSPYRTDAEKLINGIYSEMKKQGKEARFMEILKENNISTE